MITLAIWAVLALVLGAAVLARLAYGIPWDHMLGDPAAALQAPFYLGFVSNVGILLWAAAAGVFLFAARVLALAGGDARWRRFLFASGAFGALLALDDLFMLHERVLPDVLGIPQPAVAAAYAVDGLAYLAWFSPLIAASAWPVLLAAFGLLAASLGMDQLPVELYARALWEDAAKLLGIGAWLSYALATSAAALGVPARQRNVDLTPLKSLRDRALTPNS